jgi:alcohol dehydrogenase
MIGVALGARVLAVDPDPGSLALAESLGATAIPPTGIPEDVAPAMVELTDGGADVSLDAFGSQMTLAVSLACLRPRGRHVQVGLLVGADAHPEVDMGRVLGGELQLLGSHGMAASDYPELLAQISKGTLDPARLLRDRIGLAETGARLADLSNAGAGTGGVTIIRPDLP